MNADNLEIDLSNTGSEQLLKNPKARNQNRIKTYPTKKNSLKSNISYPNLEKMEKTYRYRFRRSDSGRYIANGVDAHRFFFLLAAVL